MSSYGASIGTPLAVGSLYWALSAGFCMLAALGADLLLSMLQMGERDVRV